MLHIEKKITVELKDQFLHLNKKILVLKIIDLANTKKQFLPNLLFQCHFYHPL